MKWFKHYSDAKYDTKIRRLAKKYGIVGYGIYFAVIESIAYQIKPEKPIPDLEENSQDICDIFESNFYRLMPEIVEEILLFCMHEGLLSQDETTGRITCLKLLCHLDNTMSNNPEIKKILDNFNKLQVTSSNLKQIRLDKTRLEKEINDDSINKIYDSYPPRCPISDRSTGKCSKNKDKIKSLLNGGLDTKILLDIIAVYIRDCVNTKTYVKNFATFLNNLPDIEELKKKVRKVGESEKDYFEKQGNSCSLVKEDITPLTQEEKEAAANIASDLLNKLKNR